MEEIYVNIDSRYRDVMQFPNESKFKITLNSYYKNISKIKMTSIELPNLDYLPIIDFSKNNNYIIFTLPNQSPITIYLPSPLLNSELLTIPSDANNTNFICDTINNVIQTYNTNLSISSPYKNQINLFKFYNYRDNITNNGSNKYRNYNSINVFNKIIMLYSKDINTPPNSSFSSTFDTAVFNTNNIDTSKTITIQFNIENITQKTYPTLGYYLGFRKNSYDCIMGKPVIAEEYSNFTTENYIFIKINDWGYVDIFNNKVFTKILLNSNIGDVLLNEFNTKEYIIKQPINIQTLNIELIDYLGNTISTGGKDFSFTLQLSQILNSDNKRDIEYNFLNKKTEK
jgi:hypothetical protein